jgi:hypothetical protein
MQGTTAISRGDNALGDVQFACAGGSETADRGTPRSDRTGRKEKPHEDNRKKSKRAKFRHNHFCLCEGKVSKGVQDENRAELFRI